MVRKRKKDFFLHFMIDYSWSFEPESLANSNTQAKKPKKRSTDQTRVCQIDKFSTVVNRKFDFCTHIERI
jgi:hypothetical protein